MTGQPYNTIRSEELRQLLLRVCDGVTSLVPLAWYIKDLRRAEDACRWLIASRLTGQNLMHFWAHEHKLSFLQVLAEINKGLENEDKARAIRVSRDFAR